jgi:phytol kinase
MIPAWTGIAAMLLALALLLGAVRVYQRRFSPEPEIPRKIVHVLMGLLTLSFPWLFSQRWPVVVLGVTATGVMIALRTVGPLRRGVGNVLLAVNRESLGEVCFPISVTIVWWLSFGRDPLLFVIPVLLLSVADTVAALVGLRYGRRPYSTTEAPKTVEGSVAFFVVAFASVLLPLLFWSTVPPANSLLIATLLGLLVMIFEAIAWRGLDNLFIPLGAYVFLNAQIDEPVAWLLGQLLALLALMAAGVVYRRRTTLADNGALAAALAGYVFWALGGWRWIVAPVTLFLFYAVLTPLPDEGQPRIHDMRAVMSYGAAGLWWVFVAYSTDRQELLYAFTASFAALLAMFSFFRIQARHPHWGTKGELGINLLKDWAVMFLPWMLIAGVGQRTIVLSALGMVTTAAAAIALYSMQDVTADGLPTEVRWFAQAVVAFAASSACALALGVVKP